MSDRKLLFVYNADSGLFNTLSDIGHKIFSPQTYSCNLCAISHGYLSEKKEWRSFIESLPVTCDFMHRDEFISAYPDSSSDYPAVFLTGEEGLIPCLDADAINQCRNIKDLSHLIQSQCIRES